MPAISDKDRNFINGLSAFWPAFFQDTAPMRALFDGAQIALGQVYLDMLQLVLGTSLRHMPLFSKRYYQSYLVREDQVLFVEGSSSDEDRYVHQPGEPVAGLPSLMNRVVSPTSILTQTHDYDVADGALAFRKNPFTWADDGSPLPMFPLRSVQVVFAAEFRKPTAEEDWTSVYGVKTGDIFWLRIAGGTALEATVLGIEGSALLLDHTFEELKSELVAKRLEFSVLRTPWDAQQVGVGVPGQATSVLPITATPINGVKKVASAAAASTWVGKYIYLRDAGDSHNNVYAHVTAVTPGVDATLDISYNLRTASGTLTAYLVDHGPFATEATPTFALEHSQLELGSLLLVARNLTGDTVVEGVDYALDYVTGELTFLTPWDPLYPAVASYRWRMTLASEVQTPKGSWQVATPYARGDVVATGGLTYVAIQPISPAGSFVPASGWIRYQEPANTEQTHSVRELALWGVDVLVEQEALYNNFGYLLGFRKPSSEQYRALLRGVAQLFLMGPTVERFESALNVMAGYPVILDDGEVLQAYSNGIDAQGTDGVVTDTNEGRGGSFDVGLSRFSANSANFFPSDVGAALRIRSGQAFVSYVITSFVSGTTVGISPTPPAGVNLQWAYEHNLLNKRFATTTHVFTDEDLNALLLLEHSGQSANNGEFRIAAIVSPHEVTLDAPHRFIDASAVTWRLSRSQKQTVTTTRAVYELPVSAPADPTLSDMTTWGARTFRAFDTLTVAFIVEDYVRNDTWWHNTTIPQELLQLSSDVAGRRRVTTELVEHVFNALDSPVFGDFGLAVGGDDRNKPGLVRRGTAHWYGGNVVELAFDENVPVGRSRDIGQYVTIRTPGFEGWYPIVALSTDGLLVTLDRFPPREARDRVPPIDLDAELPPLIYRRTVAYVLMDKFLKYHAIHIAIDPSAALTPEVAAEVGALVRDARPSHTYVYLEPTTSFEDELTITDANEDGNQRFLLTFGPFLNDNMPPQENRLAFEQRVKFNDAFVYTTQTLSVATTPSGTVTLAPTNPFGSGAVRKYIIFTRFNAAVTVNSGARRPAEGTDYSVDYDAATITFSPSANFGSNPANLVVMTCWLRQRLVGDPLDAGETHVCVNGSDPSIHTSTPAVLDGNVGLIDRAVQITIT